ncbi:MAG: hypothetical protein GDA65_20375 [Nitrospira sp. CR1.1]|nr:hypothetical protein [Nitrospira sp. CR1.1]MBA5869293.1 hypothetical protein [Nitrospira sp. CR2.1]
MPQDEQRGEQVADTAAIVRLSALVREHRVCWEVLPELLPVTDEQPLLVGFNLELYGAHAHGTEAPHPGCEQCRTILGHLREVAKWILPKAERPSQYYMSVRDNVILYDPVRHNRSEVTVTITILHRAQLDAPVDACEVFCLHEMEGKLKEIGARYRQWEGDGYKDAG